MPIRVAIIVVNDGQGRLLFGKRREDSKYSVPAGHIEDNEDPEKGARRELWEEAGLKPEYITFLKQQNQVDPDGHEVQLFCYTAQVLPESLPHGRNDPDSEIPKWQWVDCRGGIPKNIYENLNGPEGKENVIRQIYDLKKSDRIWLDAGFADLRKGAMQRLAPFNPVEFMNRPAGKKPIGITKPKMVPMSVAERVNLWVHAANPDYRESLVKLVKPTPEARMRSLHKLHALTQVKRHPVTGERMFLLHRGDVVNSSLIHNGKWDSSLEPNLIHHTSWTPIKEQAERHVETEDGPISNGVASAWIPESAIKHYIPQYGGMEQGEPVLLPKHIREENEVIVAPGAYDLAKPEELQKAQKFSEVKEPDKSLLFVHNLSEDNLKHAHELGGLAAPSIAIKHKDHPFTGFGEVTLIAHPNQFDPANTPTFAADAYSPRHPRPNYEIHRENLKNLQTELLPHAKILDRVSYLHNSLEDEIEQNGVQRPLENHSFVPVMKSAFLASKGIKVEPVLKEASMRWPDEVKTKAMRKFFQDNGVSGNGAPEEGFSDKYHQDLSKAYGESIKEMFGGIKGKHAREAMKEYWLQKVDDKGLLHGPYVYNFMDDAKKYNEKEPDVSKTVAGIDKHFTPQLQKEFDKWALAKIRPVQSTPYIPKRSEYSGNIRKIPYTIHNVLKEMTKRIRSAEGFNYGLGNARAKGTPQLNSLMHTKAAQGRLVSSEEFDKVKKENDQRFFDIANKIKGSSNEFSKLDGVVDALGESFRPGHDLKTELKNCGFEDVPDHVVDELKTFGKTLLDMPSEYFESKPQRIVDLGEFKAAVVPHNVKPETIKILKQHGITNIERYRKDGKDEYEERNKAVNRAASKHDLMLSEGLEGFDLEELQKSESETSKLLTHPNPTERSLALKLDSTTPEDVGVAILDPDDWVWRQAFNHKDSAHALDILSATTRDASGNALLNRHDELLKDPRCLPRHLDAMIEATKRDSYLPLSQQAERIYLLRGHPLAQHELQKSEDWGKDVVVNGLAQKALTSAAGEEVPGHLGNFKDAYQKYFSESKPLVQHQDLYENGLVSPKAVYNMPVDGYQEPQQIMVKPYREKRHLLSGWAEGSTQSLYHAAGMGDLVQKSFTQPYGESPNQIPATVIHVVRGKPVLEVPQKQLLDKNPVAKEDARKVALMDFLTDNLRHSGHLLVTPEMKLQAIDHSGAFEYSSDELDLSKYAGHGPGVVASWCPADYENTLKWWPSVQEKVRGAFDKRLGLVTDPDTAKFLKDEFEKRAGWLDSRAKEALDRHFTEGQSVVPEADSNWMKQYIKENNGVIKKALNGLEKSLKGTEFLQEQPPTGGYDYKRLLTAHPKVNQPHVDDFKKNFIDAEKVHFPKTGRGAEKKAIYGQDNNRYMVKQFSSMANAEQQSVGPFNEKNEADSNWVPSSMSKYKWPISHLGGLNEMMSQSLYHAAGIGHLHQSVHVAQIPGKDKKLRPALVIHMEPNAKTYGDWLREEKEPWNEHPEHKEDYRRISLMDYLTDNQDRHTGNLLVKENGQPMAIDHGLAFEGHHGADKPTGLGEWTPQQAWTSHVYSKRRPLLVGGQDVHSPQWNDTWKWWLGNADNIQNAMRKHLNKMPPKYRGQFQKVFLGRLHYLTRMAEDHLMAAPK